MNKQDFEGIVDSKKVSLYILKNKNPYKTQENATLIQKLAGNQLSSEPGS